MMSMDFLYQIRPEDVRPFGAAWVGPKGKFPHQESVLIADYGAQEDGSHVQVFCDAWPARFFKICAVDQHNRRHTLRTGSDQGQLCAYIAEALATGMLVIK